KLLSLIVEMCNMAAIEDFENLEAMFFFMDVCGSSKTESFAKNEYAKEKERIEFEKSLKRCSQILQKAIKQHGWDPKVDIYYQLAQMTFDQYWETIKKSFHSNFYHRN